ncbi:MAG: phosphatidate cytidylyltransferase [bacterium]|nr:phosphatidate cytidylyltransferase [bacterium]
MLPRLLTALIGAPIIIICIEIGGLPFGLLVFFISIFALYEYLFMAKNSGYENDIVIGIVAALIFQVGVLLDSKGIAARSGYPFTSMLLFLVILLFFIREFIRFDKFSLVRILVEVFGVLFILWSLLHLSLIREVHGKNWTYFLFITIWCADTAAWAIGSYYGKRKLAFMEQISPKKTFEGIIGEILGAVVASIVLKSILFRQENLIQFVLFAILISILSLISDLCESLMKRSFGFKDSSNLLPGHGGILDRFDSFLITAPVFYYFMLFRN